MHDVGVVVSFNSDSDEMARRMNMEAAKAMKYGDCTPVEALKFVTLNPAKQLRIDKRVGSLEVGKLADLVVLDADPSADIRNSDKVAKVMIGGRLYDTATLNEEVTGTRKRMPYYWE